MVIAKVALTKGLCIDNVLQAGAFYLDYLGEVTSVVIYIYDLVVFVPTMECMALVGSVVWTPRTP